MKSEELIASSEELAAAFEDLSYVIMYLMVVMEETKVFGTRQCVTRYSDDSITYTYCIAAPEKLSKYNSEKEFIEDNECVVIYFKQTLNKNNDNYDVTIKLKYSLQNYGYIKEFLDYLEKIEMDKNFIFDEIYSIVDEFVSKYRSKPNTRILNKKD